jgi:hypothetical protein
MNPEKTPQQENPINSEKLVKSNKEKIIFVIITAIIAIILAILVAFTVLWYNGFFKNNNEVAITNSSTSSFQSTTSSTYSYQPSISFPSLFQYTSIGNSNSNNTQSNQSSRVLPPPYNVALKLKKSDNLQTNQIISSDCGNNIFTTNGLVEIKNLNNIGTNIVIGHKDMVLGERDQRNYQLALNFINKNTNLMGDESTGFGPDYLQFLRKDCSQSIIQKGGEINDIKLANTDGYRVIADIRSPNSFIDVTVNIYAKKGDYIFNISKTQSYSQFFTRDQISNCLNQGNPDRVCLLDTLKNDSSLLNKLKKEADQLVIDYELE